MTDGAGNCATARASLSLEDLENEMRRAIPRPVHHNEFFSQRWAIFAPPLFFARLPAIRSAPQRGRTAKVKALLGRVLSEGQLRHQAQQPSTSLRRGAARGLCGRKSKKFGLFWVRFGRENFPASDFRQPNGYRSSPPYPQRNLVIFQT